ncbi:MAG: hypothetical protein JNK53_08000, partial [Phycisphaerae bacterium]|nr:hypothetical protein [Phycisphaerae bacterium]
MPFGSYIANGLQLAINYADALCKGIPADKFAHMPAKDFCSPAFYMGHLSIYAPRVLDRLGRAELATPNPAGWEDLFKAGAVCVDEPGRYPAKEAIVAHFTTGYTACLKALREAPDSAFALPNPVEGR